MPEHPSPSTASAAEKAGQSENSPVPSVWLIVLHWRGIDVTRACLSSLNGLTYKNYRTLLVDNGSTDNDGEVLGKEFPQVEVLRLADNLGFSGGSNRGIAACLDRQADFIWLLNNDTTVQPESLELLVAEAMQQPKAALLGAAIVESQGDGAQQIVASAGKIDFARAKTSVVKSAPVSQAVSCEWLHGANLLMRSTAIRQIGMFDDRYYLYFEDTELCHRARQAGWLCIFVPQARITHIGNASTIG
ncbi:MAG TPA: glycosyltransferase family 2 protein, partial [Chroococcales cyanobacterium]